MLQISLNLVKLCVVTLFIEKSLRYHFRDEHRTPEGEAKRDDENFTHVSVWEYTGEGKEQTFTKEDLTFENVKLSTRSYK